jgi:2-amino-4-hydroxy-6-hydroxymethyldihydropteridine diphosphokinase
VKTTYLSLGSNLGDREGNLRAAIDRLKPRRVSPIYETEPVDHTAQPFFLNLVVEAETSLMPMQLLAHTQRIERELGRRRTIPKGPRTIDIDILFFGDRVIRAGRLEVPHPRLHERRFVLQPLADLAPDLRHPVTHRTVREMLAGLPSRPAVRLWNCTGYGIALK